MNLEHGIDPVSARWNKETENWDIGQKVKYRWLSSKNSPESDWFYDISDALEWIINHDRNRKCGVQ